MTAGYVRLSRDDDKKNYVSIENQKLIITQYAADHGRSHRPLGMRTTAFPATSSTVRVFNR